jgi:hypothetical protein
MRQLYYAHAYPHLIVSITIWGSEDKHKVYLQPLIRTQKRLIRIIKHVPPKAHTKPLMKDLKTLHIFNLYIHRVCLEMHPFIHHTNKTNRPEHDHNYIWLAQIHDYPTRSSLQRKHFIPNSYHPNAKKREQVYTAAHFTAKYTEIWNRLPLDLRERHSLPDFKTALKKYLLVKQNDEN